MRSHTKTPFLTKRAGFFIFLVLLVGCEEMAEAQQPMKVPRIGLLTGSMEGLGVRDPKYSCRDWAGWVLTGNEGASRIGGRKSLHKPREKEPTMATERPNPRPSDMQLIRDPIEDDPRYREILERADAETREELAGKERNCYVFWKVKKRILKERHGLDWKTPAELNPTVLFD
jgi:hypothetical protein